MTLVDRKDVRGLKREILGQFVRTVERDIAFAEIIFLVDTFVV